MAIRPTAKGIKRGQERTIQSLTLPAPQGGVDARSPLATMAGSNSIYSYNLTVQEGAVEVRSGYREWSLGLEQTSNLSAGTLIPHTTAGNNYLWAVTNEGIWNVTDYNTAPIHELQPNSTGVAVDDWTDTSAEASYGVFTAFTADNGDEYVLYADSRNGLWQRNISVPTSPELWIRPNLNNPASGPDVNVENINFVIVHKQRMWVVEKDQNHAHYLGIGAISGQTTAFFFGSKFKYGGGIAGLFNWTVDGGAGVDDYLVAVGEGGDLIPYKGIDPSQDDWQNVGSFYIGKPPIGGTFASEYAGELYFLSEFGVIAMSDILKGVDLGDSNRNPNSLSFLITKLLRKDVAQRSNNYGWQMIFAPSRGDLIINTPQAGVAQPTQYVLNLSMGAWSFWRDIPMSAVIDWNTSVYMLAEPSGATSSNAYIMDVNRDNVKIVPPTSGQNGDDINFSILTSFSRLGADTVYKKVQYVRTDFLASNSPTLNTKVLYDYNINEPTTPVSPPDEGVLVSGLWDISTWDNALWAQGEYGTPSNVTIGADGMGRSIAIAIRGTAIDQTVLLSWDISWIAGNYAL